MKKTICFLLACVMCASMAACAGVDLPAETADRSADRVTAAPDADESAATTTAATTIDATPTTTVPVTSNEPATGTTAATTVDATPTTTVPVTSDEPATTTTAATTIDALPTATVPATSEVPVTTAPTTTTKAPTTTTKAPVTTTRAPTTTTKAPTTTKPPVTEQTPVAANIQTLLNSAPLRPLKTNSPTLDRLVDDIFDEILTDDMTTYEKVKACFDYLVNNCTYGTSFMWGLPDDVIYLSNYDARIVMFGYAILNTNIGVCDNYSAAFVIMCRRIGLDAYEVGGTVSKKGSNERTGHAWTYINLNGTQYIFDPQVQSNNMQAPYFFFGKTYEQMGTRYQLDDRENTGYDDTTFADFECYETPDYNLSVTLTLSADDRSEEHSCTQQGMSVSTSVHSANESMMTDDNGDVTITVTPSGGSGQYIYLIYVTDDEMPEGWLLYEGEIEGENISTLAYATFPSELNSLFHIYIVDALNDYSYVLLENIRFTLPENFETPAGE